MSARSSPATTQPATDCTSIAGVIVIDPLYQKEFKMDKHFTFRAPNESKSNRGMYFMGGELKKGAVVATVNNGLVRICINGRPIVFYAGALFSVFDLENKVAFCIFI